MGKASWNHCLNASVKGFFWPWQSCSSLSLQCPEPPPAPESCEAQCLKLHKPMKPINIDTCSDISMYFLHLGIHIQHVCVCVCLYVSGSSSMEPVYVKSHISQAPPCEFMISTIKSQCSFHFIFREWNQSHLFVWFAGRMFLPIACSTCSASCRK